jgi:hypothetical protein
LWFLHFQDQFRFSKDVLRRWQQNGPGLKKSLILKPTPLPGSLLNHDTMTALTQFLGTVGG